MRAGGHASAAAIAMICAATLCFSILDSMMKFLSTRYPLSLLLAVRWGIQAVVLAAWFAPRTGAGFLRTSRPLGHLARGAFLMAASLCFMLAIRTIPLAEATAIHYTTPMFVAVMATFALGERMTVSRALFILAGAIGMTLIVKPGMDVFQGAALFVLMSAFCYAIYLVLTRRMAGESATSLVIYPSLVCAAGFGASMPFLAGDSFAIAWTHFAMLVASALLGTTGHFLFALAFRRADATAVTPFSYSQIVWATIVGWVVFSNLPDAASFAGMLIIAGGGLALALHERRQSRATVPVPPVAE